MSGFDEALEQAINALHQGVPMDDCLARTPEHAEQLSADLLARVVALGARDVILDLTGIATIDAQVAGHISRTVASTRLVGARCTLVGLSPRAAQEFVALQVPLGAVHTLQTLGDALRTVVGLTRAT